jgi:peroxiredoxin
MTISVGDKIPDVEVFLLGPDGGPAATSSAEILGSGKVVLFGVPGAFTPICDKEHLPGFVSGAEALAGKGVDKIVCTSVNDVWTMDAWAKAHDASDKIQMVSDGNAALAKAMGLEFDLAVVGLGTRSRRFAAVIDDGIVTHLEVSPDASVATSSCAVTLAAL